MMKKKKFSWKQMMGHLFFILIGAACGILIAKYLNSSEKTAGETFFSLAVLFIGMYLAIFLQIIIHEAGHLIFGYFSGYRFSSFRIGSLILLKEDNVFRVKRLSVAGTGGQCLMIPPAMHDGTFPVILYNLGGPLINLVSSLVFTGCYIVFRPVKIAATFFLMLTVIGVAFALMNGIPMRLGTVDNDGYNACSLGRNPAALRAFWIQLKTNELISRNVRLKDMPDEWFKLPEKEELNNSMTATLAVFACNRLIDEHRFEEGEKLMDELFSQETAIIGLHKNLLVCDRIYCRLLDGDLDAAASMLDQEQLRFMKSMKKFPSVLRTHYVFTLFTQDADAADTFLKQFEACARTYPYASDIESERELIAIAEELYKEKDHETTDKQ